MVPPALNLDLGNLVARLSAVCLHSRFQSPDYVVKLAHRDLQFSSKEITKGIHGQRRLVPSSPLLWAGVQVEEV